VASVLHADHIRAEVKMNFGKKGSEPLLFKGCNHWILEVSEAVQTATLNLAPHSADRLATCIYKL